MAEQKQTDHFGPQDSLLASFRVPVWATLLFVVAMLAVYFLAGEVIEFYGLRPWPSWWPL
ncbi:MAG: hypothetical protein HKN13_08385 [Rhodothermales bacterium]|nr:hypothetical protein [Rhodothermales bacterium]